VAVARGVLQTIILDKGTPHASQAPAAWAILAAGLRQFELVALTERVSALEDRQKDRK
jgi:hypothetical protein